MSRYLKCAPHEGDVRFTFGVHPDPAVIDHGLAPYYAMHGLMKEWGDKWKSHGKPSREVQFRGKQWATVFDYSKSGLDPWSHQSFQIEEVREFHFYFVAKDSPHYSGRPADQDQRVEGGTITVRPRWPNLTSNGKPVSVPDYGGPYLDVQVQASNIPHESYLTLVKRVMDAYGIAGRYFDQPHPDSHINDLAYYVRLYRSQSGPLFAPDGPIARCHTLIQGDRSGYRKHVEDNTKLPGYYVTATVEDEKASELIRGHKLGKELKHYYPEHPEVYDPDDAPYHPKFEVSYQTARTEETVRWDDLADARRELEETILNCLEWCGIATTADGSAFVKFDPYWTVENTNKARKLVACPLPKIEDDQEHRVMKLWGEMTQSDRDVTELLLADGGKISPQEAATRTGYTYRTIRRVIDRLEGLIEHSYGELEIVSKHVQQKLLKRVRAAGGNFEQAIGSAVMDLADEAEERPQNSWTRLRREYAISIDTEPADCRKLLTIGYQPADRDEARELLDRVKSRYSEHVENNLFGVHVVVTYQDGSKERFRDLATFRGINGTTSVEVQQRHREHNDKVREGFDWDSWMTAEPTG
ncbi:MarR family transcriptional regulator [Halorientalis brevis]|uniref:MarR family transcriptional regulator n=1 Tax=Halorientalis brevis TaxID=1126241 RepID=A0ABD6C6S7_9EURY|nr:MarR family transcriptional regulator [Halorientalis brevis]